MTTTTDAVLAVEAALTEMERTAILRRVTRSNSSLDGAKVADVLYILYDAGAYLMWTEPFYETPGNADRLNRYTDPPYELMGYSVLAAAILAQGVPTLSAVERILSGAVSAYRTREQAEMMEGGQL